ncbi:MAG TPA: cyclase family protein [Feifaniaceae bacterium]|nr:cyclase family protein [Feifaniaceae bacterium]
MISPKKSTEDTDMLIDITLQLTPEMIAEAGVERSMGGHIGTHFDVMNKEFPLEFTKRKGIVFDVSRAAGRDVAPGDVDLSKVSRDMFAAFYTGFIERVGYGGAPYFGEHPQLSHELIDRLLDKGVSVIGIDFAGVRREAEHTAKDQYCADRGAFVIENLCSLRRVLAHGDGSFTAHTYPMRCTGLTGLPCRVIAEL